MKNFTRIFLLSALLILCGTSRLFAQAPANDNCANAILLTPALACNPTPGTTQNATNSNPPGNCGGGQHDVWYRFVATATKHQVRVDGTPAFDAVIGALTSCGGTTRPTGGDCSDYAGNDGVEILNLSGLTVGLTYYIQVYDYYGNITAAADFDICVRSAPPANDECANATLLTPGFTCSPMAGTTENATASNAPCDCDADQKPDVWYRFVATSSTHQVRVDGGLAFDGKIGALTDCGGTERPTGGLCTDGSGSDGLEILDLSDLTVGSTYYIQVYDFYGGITSTADFTICVLTLHPANDDCANATPLTSSGTCVATAGTTENATGGGQGNSCGVTQSDVWYSFVATNSTYQVQVDGAAGFDAVVAAWTDCSLTQHPPGGDCRDGSGDDGVETLNLTGLTIGNTYYIQVYDFYGATSFAADFDICGVSAAPNDNCANAILLTPSATCVPTAGTTENATDGGQGNGCGITLADVWYSFVAISPTERVRVDGTPGFDAVISVWTDCSATVHPTGGDCIDASGDDGVETLNLSGLTVGQTYYIQVYDFYGSNTSGSNFDICVFGPPPANDRCAQATAIANGSVVNMSTLQATDDNSTEVPTCTATSRVKGVWFVYTAAAGSSGTVTLSGCATNFDDQVSVYRTADNNCPASGNSPVCVIPSDNTNDCNGGAENTSFAYSAPALHPDDSGAEFLAPVKYYIYVSGPGGNLNFTVSDAPTPLPLELVNFTGEIQGSMNVLHWETLTEKNMQFHAVERSLDGTNWQEVGRKNGLTNSNVLVKYTLEDRNPLAKTYYRLRSVDLNGQENLSNTIVLTRPGEGFGITGVFPSPTKSNVTVQFNATQEEPVTIRVMDMSGRLLLKTSVEAVSGGNELPLILDGVPAGVYMVQVSNGLGTSAAVRFVKSRL